MTPRLAVFTVGVLLILMAVVALFHRQLRPQLQAATTKVADSEAATKASKIEQLRRDEPLPPPPAELTESKLKRSVHTVIIKKPETIASPTPLAKMAADPLPQPLSEDAHPVKVETLPAQSIKAETPSEKPIMLLRPRQARSDDDEPKHNNDGVCARYGGHKVIFHKRNGWESWRCVYPHRH